jgi:hypothetical protein
MGLANRHFIFPDEPIQPLAAKIVPVGSLRS